MYDKADIGLVNAHAEGVGGHDDAHFVALPVCLSLVFYGSVEAGMIEGGCDVVLVIEEFGNLFGTFPAAHIDNG